MINYIKNYLTPAKLKGLILILIGLCLLVFINQLELLFRNENSVLSFLTNFRKTLIKIKNPAALQGLSLLNIPWLFFNIGFAVLIFSKEKHEDERVERIRNYAAKATFRFAVVTLLLLALFLQAPNIFLIALYIQAYYIILFKLCLYRDSALVYIDHDKVREHLKKNSKAFNTVMMIMLASASIVGGISAYFAANDFMICFLVTGAVYNFGLTIFWHWKSTSFIEPL